METLSNGKLLFLISMSMIIVSFLGFSSFILKEVNISCNCTISIFESSQISDAMLRITIDDKLESKNESLIYTATVVDVYKSCPNVVQQNDTITTVIQTCSIPYSTSAIVIGGDYVITGMLYLNESTSLHKVKDNTISLILSDGCFFLEKYSKLDKDETIFVENYNNNQCNPFKNKKTSKGK